MPPMNGQRRIQPRCQPHDEAMALRQLADQFVRGGELLKARNALHDLYMFNPANANVFQEIRTLESQPRFREMEKDFIGKLKGKFRN